MFEIAAAKTEPNRHTVDKVLALYSWIEPTTLFTRIDASPSATHGYGVLAGTHETSEKPAYPKATQISEGSLYIAVAYEHRSTRTVPGLVHMYKHTQGGLAT